MWPAIVAVRDDYPVKHESEAESLDEATEERYRQMAYGKDY